MEPETIFAKSLSNLRLSLTALGGECGDLGAPTDPVLDRVVQQLEKHKQVEVPQGVQTLLDRQCLLEQLVASATIILKGGPHECAQPMIQHLCSGFSSGKLMSMILSNSLNLPRWKDSAWTC